MEITDINKIYLESNELEVLTLGRGFAWIDAGTIDALSEASEFIRIIEKKQGIKIAAIEEIAFKNKWIDKEQLDVYKRQIIFSQKRYGINKKHFKIYKFRTMNISAPKNVATRNLEDSHVHITKFGRILRKTSLDELPQLINI